MSVHVSSWLWRNSTAKGSELLLLLAIADWADDNGKAWPSVDTLSQKTRLSRRQTQTIIRQSVAEGRLSLHQNQGPNATNIYQIIMGGEKIAPVQSSVSGGAVQRTGGAVQGIEGVRPTAPNTSIDTSTDTSKDTSLSLSHDFDKWYSHYPKKVGRATAQAAFRKAIKIVALDTLIDAVELHKTSAQWTRDNGQFIPHPSTWLTQRRWEDEVVVAANQSRTHDPVGYSDDPEEARRQLNDDLEKLARGEL